MRAGEVLFHSGGKRGPWKFVIRGAAAKTPTFQMRRSTALLLALGIIVLLAANSADFLFRQPFYEHWDSAANSLSILRARHFSQLYGPYSRYVFYHPGPAFFYVQAFGEWLFYDALHLVVTPFQGQLLINLCLMTGFFVAALSVFAHRLPERRRWLFLCVALGLGIVHFGLMGNLPSMYDMLGGTTAFLSVWSAHSLVLPFLCLLTAGAAVGAGWGRNLPLLVVAGGFLMEHVAQPLFVGPTAAVAYLGLIVSCARRQHARASGAPDGTGKSPRGGWLLAAWREYPRAHLLAGGFLFLFLLPMLIDLCWGKQSNFAAILRHLHAQESDRKHLGRSLCYFLLFATYRPYLPGQVYFGHYDLSGFVAYLRAHALFYVGWLVVLGLAAQAPLAYIWPRARRVDGSVPAAVNDRRRFLAWAALLAALNIGLTLYWGTRQDGLMYYYNSWFNFAIYYFGALIAAAVLCAARSDQTTAGETGAEAGRARSRLPLARLLGVGAVILLADLFAGRLRIHNYFPEGANFMHASVERARAATNANRPPVCKVLFVPEDYWTTAVGVGLQLARAGDPFVVAGRWKNTFGAEHDWQRLTPQSLQDGLCPWYIGPSGTVRRGVSADAPTFVLRPDASLAVTPTTLEIMPPTLELSASVKEANIDFMLGGHAADFFIGGFGQVDAGGTWNAEPMAALAFRPQAVQGTSVEIIVTGAPCLAPAHGVTRQRIRLYFNGTCLCPEQQLSAPGSVVFNIPVTTWNAAAANPMPIASLAFQFPDAVSPASLDPGNPHGDPRNLGLFVHDIHLRVSP